MPSFNNKTSEITFLPTPSTNNNNNNNNNITNTNNNNNIKMVSSNKLFIDDDFVLNTFATMDGLLAQYEAILTYERKQLLAKQKENSRPLPCGFLTTATRFWEFKIENETTTYVRYGNVRDDGSLKERATQTQHHLNAHVATLFIERLIDEKLKAGFTGWTKW